MALEQHSATSWWNWFLSSDDEVRAKQTTRPDLESLEDRVTPSVSLVRNIDLGFDSDPEYLTNVNGTLFFSASDGTRGYELWRSDGTAAGTQIVREINLQGNTSPRELTNVNGTLFFSADDGSERELWKSDGTFGGTTLVKDINPGPTFDSDPRYLENVNGILFFQAFESTSGTELWKSDGTFAGTQLVKDIDVVVFSSYPSNLTNVNGRLFFAAEDGNYEELWVSDGTNAGTVPVTNFDQGLFLSFRDFTEVGNNLFFTFDDGTSGRELWKSDGTQTGTMLVRDIDLNGSSFPSYLTNVNGTLFFSADDNSATDRELWKSDGTFAGTQVVKDIDAGNFGSSPRELANINGILYFSAFGNEGRELWKSDGTDAGTVLVKDIETPFGSSNPANITELNGRIVFSASGAGNEGTELWASDGTSAGTQLASDIYPGFFSSNPRYLTNVGGTLFFSADDGTNGRELWRASVAVSVPDLVDASDTGDSNTDNITRDNTPTFQGTTEANAVIQLFDGPTGLATTTADASGNWTVTLTTPLADGFYNVTARATLDGISNVSAPLFLVIDTSPRVNLPDLDPASDSGISNRDNITNIRLPRFNGFAEPNSTLELFDGGTLLGTTTTDASGNWTITVASPLSEGSHTITARVTAADGRSSTSAALSVIIDTMPQSVTINRAIDQPNPTTDTSIRFTAIFSDPVVGFKGSDVVLGGTAGATTVDIVPVGDSQTEYTVLVSGMTREGTVTVSIPGGVVFDAAGQQTFASTSTDNTFNFRLFRSLLAVGADAGGAPLVQVFDTNGNSVFGFFAFDPAFTGGVRVATGDINGDFVEDIVVAAGAGGGPHVKIFDGVTGELIREFFAYGAGFAGGVYVAVGDVNNDGFADVITGAGAGGGPHVKVFDGASGTLIREFFAYANSFVGGVRVAAGDINGDGTADVITGAGPGGGPHVRAFDVRTGTELRSFFAYGAGFAGGVYVGAGDVNNDGLADIITGAGAGGGPHVRVFSGQGNFVLNDYFAYEASFTGGVRVAIADRNGDGFQDVLTSPGPGGSPLIISSSFPAGNAEFFNPFGGFAGGVNVASGDVNGDGFADYVVAADTGGGPVVNVYDGQTLALIRSVFAYSPGFQGGVRVAVGDVTGDGFADIITGAGPGGSPHVKVLDGRTGAQILSFFAFGETFAGGIFVASGDVNNDGFADIIVSAGSGGSPLVRVFDGNNLSVLKDFVAYDATFAGGVRVSSGDVTGDGFADIITGAGPGGAPHVKVFDGRTDATVRSFFAYDGTFTGGVYVGAGDRNGDGFADIITGAGSGGSPLVRVFDSPSLAELSSFFAFSGNFLGGARVAGGDFDGDGVADILSGTGPGAGSLRKADFSLFVEVDRFFALDGAFAGGTFIG